MAVHFKAESLSLGSLHTPYPHTPTDDMLSIQDYLEDQFSQGWEIVSVSDGGPSGFLFVFKANGQ